VKKFVRRHKVSVLTGSAIVAALVVGLVAASIGFFEARRQTRIAREQVAHGNRGWALMLNAEAKGNSDRARALAREALAIHRELHGDDHPEVCSSLHVLSMTLGKSDLDEAISVARQATANIRKYATDRSSRRECAYALDNLANLLLRKGEVAEPDSLYRETLPMWRELFGDDHPTVANTLDHLAAVAGKQSRLAEAENYMRECLAIRERVLGPRHASTVIARRSLIDLLKKQGKDAEAEKVIAAATIKVEAK
jgi:tetratricopeptide (TPR) repeat protein